MRQQIVVANWKMHKTIKEALPFVAELKERSGKSSVKIFIAAPFTFISPLVEEAGSDADIFIGAQNMHDALEGPFTGEISAAMLKEVGASFVLLGHSERRIFFGEKDDFISRKVKRAIELGLTPILCVGETEEEYLDNKTEEVLSHQLTAALNDCSANQFDKIVIAYEPVWAIGTGKSASAAQAQRSHHFCRKVLAALFGTAAADTTPLLYGGSVKVENASLLLSQSDIDGLLVGGASLDIHSFIGIINSF